MLRIEPSQKPRLLQIETNTVERLDEARKMAWLGEVAALLSDTLGGDLRGRSRHRR